MLRNVDYSPFVNYFFKIYFKDVLNDILSVLTDTFHQPGLKLHAKILRHLIRCVSSSGKITEPIWKKDDMAKQLVATSNNRETGSNWTFVKNFLLKILKDTFPNLTEIQVSDIVNNLLSACDEKTLKGHRA